ncbi:hypothetical protein SASPL_108212 [Salvia splendens]|uniref:Glycosyltransferase n=1 Tax=Salvia splendens TaxID=180675 RepID=A0A8X8YDW2_SALSN|nr:UDP-glycosyltransferase 73C2-like [Salvia splendens]KAG6430150.1 hypothetical protein SASPL_108212 [Salvia splendens]
MAAEIHVVLFPMVAPGHMNPIIDIAKLLARRGLIVSFITTPANAARISFTISPALQIHLIQIPFPAAEAGLPDACENMDSLPSLETSYKFIIAFDMMQNDVVRAFEQLQPPPSCLISDMGLPWTAQLAEQFNIPRIVFHGTSCTSLLVSHHKKAVHAEAPDVEDAKSTVMKKVWEQVRAAEKTSYGVVVNSFEGLEAESVKEYSEAKGGRVWCIGPVSLCNVETSDMEKRGNISAVDVRDCMQWLDLHEPGSVIYAALGSLARPTPEQMMELALALEETNRPFIWGLGGASSPALEGLFVESGFAQRTRDRGLLIRGWAPQLMILSHPAVGGFLTHCGWNSTLEGIAAGVPLATWPFVGDQFTNEKLVVEILGIGVSVGNKVRVMWGEEEKAGVFVAKDAIKRALVVLMEEGAEMRTRAGELRDKAKMAVAQGGSSYLGLTLLIEEIKARF